MTVLEYLQEQKELTLYDCFHNTTHDSKAWKMESPKPGKEKEFEEAKRKLEIIEELKALVLAQGGNEDDKSKN